MAVEEKKVLSEIELKFKGKSISKDFKKALAAKWAPKIDNDTDIETYINDREDVILEAAAEGDRRATEASKKSKEAIVKTVTGEEVKTEEEEPTTEYGKLMKVVTGLAKTIETMQQKDTSKTLTERFNSDPRLKGIDPKLLKGRVPATETELEAAIAETAEDLKDFIKAEGAETQTGVKVGFKSDRPGFGGTKVDTKTAEKVPDAIGKFTDVLNKSSQVKT